MDKLKTLRISSEIDSSGYVKGGDAIAASAKKIDEANKAVGISLAKNDAALRQAALNMSVPDRAAIRLSDNVSTLSKRFIDGYSAGSQFNKAIQDVGRAMDKGMGLDRATVLLAGIYTKFNQVADSTTLLKQGFANLAPAIDMANAAMGSKASAASYLETLARVKQLRAEIDPLAVAEDKRRDRLLEYNKLLKQGAIEQSFYDRAIAVEQRKYELTERSVKGTAVYGSKQESGAGLARYEAINLSRQLQDVFVSLSSGQNPLTVLIQQGTQIADVFAASNASAKGFFTQAASFAGQFITSWAGVATAVAGSGAAITYMGYSFGSAQREVERSITGIGKASGTTVAQINAIAEASSSASRISISSAREVISGFAATGRVGPESYDRLVQATRNYSAQTGQSLSDAGSELAKAFSDPLKGADELNAKLGFLDGRTRDYIKTLVQQNDRSSAQKVLLDALSSSTVGAADKVGILQRAWESVSKAVSNAADNIGKAVAGTATTTERLDRLTKSGSAGSDRTSQDYQQARRQREAAQYYKTREPQIPKSIVNGDSQRNLAEDLNEQLRREGAFNSLQSNQSIAAAGSIRIRSITEGFDKTGESVKALNADLRLLEDQLSTAMGRDAVDNVDKVRSAIEKIGNAVSTIQTPLQRIAVSNDLALRSIEAKTLADRISLEVDREKNNLAGQAISSAERLAAITGKVAQVQAEANKETREALKVARDRLNVSNLRPYERTIAEIGQRERDFKERNSGSGTTNTREFIKGFEGYKEKPYFDVTRLRAGYGSDSTTSASGVVKQVTQDTRVSIEDAERDLTRRISGFQNTIKKQLGAGVFESLSGQAQASLSSVAYNYGNLPSSVVAAVKSGNLDTLANAIEALGGHNGGVNRDRRKKEADNIRVGSNSDINSIFDAERATAKIEAYNNVIRAANDDIDMQSRALRSQAEAFFMTTEQIAEASKSQELYNKFTRDGVAITSEMVAQIGNTAKRYGELAKTGEEVTRTADAIRDLRGAATDPIKGFLSDIGRGVSAADAFSNALNRMKDRLLDLALNDLFKSGGIIQSLLTGFYPKATATGSPGADAGPAPFAKGGTFTNSVVSSPTLFPFANGTGLMGEAGPEAIMPLKRNNRGQLGVIGAGSGRGSSGVSVNIVNQTSVPMNSEPEVSFDGNRINILIEDKVRAMARNGTFNRESDQSRVA
jgi:phage-related minor tail protein/GH24 family phage-related lysozyme (muramidase)